MTKTESTRNTCIVVVEVLLDNESTIIGALTDSVEEVIDLEPDQIQPAPRIGTQIRTDFIKGMGKRDTQFIMILDIDRVFSAEELTVVRGQQEAVKQEAVKQEAVKQEAAKPPAGKKHAADQQLVAA
jgi:purine-binding chemotaxis protein CheW